MFNEDRETMHRFIKGAIWYLPVFNTIQGVAVSLQRAHRVDINPEFPKGITS